MQMRDVSTHQSVTKTILAMIGGAILVLPTLVEATLIWDTVQGNTSVESGNGVWDTITPNWNDSGTNVLWNGTSASFGLAPDGTSPNVTIVGNVTANALEFPIPFHATPPTLSGGTLTLVGPDAKITTSGTVSISTGIEGNAGLTKFGSGTLRLSGPTNFSGGTLIKGGTVVVVEPSATMASLGTGPITLNGGVFAMQPFATSSNITYTNDIVAFGRSIINFETGSLIHPQITRSFGHLTTTGPVDFSIFSSNPTVTSSVAFSGADVGGNLTLSGQTSLSINGPITSLAGSQLYIGGGCRLILNGTVTFSGGIIADSALTIGPNGNVVNSPINVLRGASLSGKGSVGAVTVANQAGINPGVAFNLQPIGSLTLGPLSMSGGSSLRIDIAGSNLSQYDQLRLIGEGSVGDVILSIDFLNGFQPNVGSNFFLIDNDGTDPIVGNFRSFPEGVHAFTEEGFEYMVTYQADANGNGGTGSFTGGNDFAIMILTVVPEPSVSIVVLCGVLLLMARYRPQVVRKP